MTEDTRNIVLRCRDVGHWFGAKKVLHAINLEIAAGQIVSLVGPSGSGKSTLLRAILGTHPPRRGEVLVSGREVTKPTRQVGIVYQHYSLFDFLTVRKNVAFGLKLDQTNVLYRTLNLLNWLKLSKLHQSQALELLEKVGLSEAVDLYPHELSGGMRQRVAIAQALIMKPNILLLDEPFGALDEAMREDLQMMLLQLYQENIQARERGDQPPHTILIVTHELNEALYVADRVLGLSQYHSDGQLGATIVYDKPAPVFRPNDPKDFSRFVQQKEELLKAVFSEDGVQHHLEYVSFWGDQARANSPAGP